MRTAQGPFPMETTYTWAGRWRGPDPHDAAQPRRAGRVLTVAAPFMAPAMRRANRKDLRRLKGVLEACRLAR